MEAGIDINFREIEEDFDRKLRSEAWEEYINNLYVGDNSDILQELSTIGINIHDLADLFYNYTDYPDINEWPVPDKPHIDTESIL